MGRKPVFTIDEKWPDLVQAKKHLLQLRSNFILQKLFGHQDTNPGLFIWAHKGQQ